MINKSQLKQAVAQGIINQQQMDALITLTQQSSQHHSGEEHLRFVRGFGDVFITLGILLVAISFNFTGLSGYYYGVPIGIFILAAEWLVRVRKLSLPGMAILICIIYFVNALFTELGQEKSFYNLGLITATSLAFYLRYKMPFSLLPTAGSIIVMLIYTIGIDIIQQPYLLSLMGLMVFSMAMWFDARDTQRQNYLSDSAFWLHLLAAPLIAHGVMIVLVMAEPGSLLAVNRNLFIISFFVLFFLIALFIDRRALLISSTVYAIYAITQLASGQFADVQSLIAFVFMAFGIFVVLFGTYWYKVRNLLFGWCRKTAIAQYIPNFR
ncbi:MAG: hypothetical protein OEY52_08395 [Gammaproteobacteria bacterium]|nr:hypothetical protein [Gammaproteobacteria bacterium]